MKKTAVIIAAIAVAGAASAAVYNDATGEEFSLNDHLDLVSVEIQNDATDIMFTINLVGDPVAVNWGKYLVGIDSVAGGDVAGNGWGRPISMPRQFFNKHFVRDRQSSKSLLQALLAGMMPPAERSAGIALAEPQSAQCLAGRRSTTSHRIPCTY